MSPQTVDTLRPLFEVQEPFEPEVTAKVTNPPPAPAIRAKGRNPGRKAPEQGAPPMNIAANVASPPVAPSAGGNLAHPATNDNRYNVLLDETEKLGAVAGQGEDVQIKHLLLVTQAAFEGVIDNTENKHGTGTDDATQITERYWKARNKNVIFNPKAANQRKTISTVRQVISLGGWSKGGPGEPIGMVNRAMTSYKKLRQDPAVSKRLMDAANYLVLIARRMKKSDQLLDDDELRSLAFKSEPDIATVEDVLDNMRKTLTKMQNGKHPAGACDVETVIKPLNKILKGIADAKRNVGTAQAAADITAAANAQAKAGDAAPATAA